MATIRDVAKRCEVSIATVSRVLNGSDDKVGPETRARVLEAMRELRYRPTARQENQRAVATHNIGFLVSDLDREPFRRNPYFAGLFEGVLDEAASSGYSATVFVERMWREKKLAIRRSYDGHCDGIIAMAPESDSETVHLLHERGIPLVLIGSDLPLNGVSTLDIDNAAAAGAAVRALVGVGHRRIAYFGVPDRVVSSMERRLGCAAAVEATSGASLRQFLAAGSTPMQSGRFREANGWEGEPFEGAGVHRLLWVEEMIQVAFAAAEPPTAIVAWNDEMARDTVEALRRRGLSVPGDVSLIAFDDTPPIQTCDPPLTCVPQPLLEMGRQAVGLLVRHLAEPTAPVQRVRIRPELVHRGSVAPPPHS
ncbi:MAG: LacI family DNA-binding transcriptional regulator [Fimbriimonas sp.]